MGCVSSTPEPKKKKKSKSGKKGKKKRSKSKTAAAAAAQQSAQVVNPVGMPAPVQAPAGPEVPNGAQTAETAGDPVFQRPSNPTFDENNPNFQPQTVVTQGPPDGGQQPTVPAYGGQPAPADQGRPSQAPMGAPAGQGQGMQPEDPRAAQQDAAAPNPVDAQQSGSMPPAPPQENAYPPIAASDRSPAPDQDRGAAGSPEQQGYDNQRSSPYGSGGYDQRPDSNAYSQQRPTAESRPDSAAYSKPEQPEYKNQGGYAGGQQGGYGGQQGGYGGGQQGYGATPAYGGATASPGYASVPTSSYTRPSQSYGAPSYGGAMAGGYGGATYGQAGGSVSISGGQGVSICRAADGSLKYYEQGQEVGTINAEDARQLGGQFPPCPGTSAKPVYDSPGYGSVMQPPMNQYVPPVGASRGGAVYEM